MTTEPASPRTVSRAEAIPLPSAARGDLAQAAERQTVEQASQFSGSFLDRHLQHESRR